MSHSPRNSPDLIDEKVRRQFGSRIDFLRAAAVRYLRAEAPRLLMAALLEGRDRGLVELRLAGERGWRGRLRTWDPGLVQVGPLATPALGGLCGQIIKRLERKGEQGAVKLLKGLADERRVIDQVESELADRG